MTIKVIVTGAYSTGKTTLVEDLDRALGERQISCKVLPDISRRCPMPLNTEQTDETTLWLIGSQVAAEIEGIGQGYDVLLCDRGIPDILSHHLEVLARRAESRVELMRPFLNEWLSTYELLLFSRVDEKVPIAADGLRNTDPTYRSLLDHFAAQVLEGRPATVTLPFGEDLRLATGLQAVTRRLGVSEVSAK